MFILCISLLFTTANPYTTANQATGNVKTYQLMVGGILLTILPISYIVLNLGAPAYSVFIVHLCAEIIAQICRMVLLRKNIKLSIKQYVRNIYLPVLAVIVVSILLPILVHSQMEMGWIRFITVVASCILSVGFSAFFIGLTKNERLFFLNKGLRIIAIRK